MGDRTPNRLINETSPYLLQHAYNPVDWLPWSDDVRKRSKQEDKPIFISIGYSACHWCHVMERESFEDPLIAELLNRHFIPVKVDREERPDVDQYVMDAVQFISGRGGWPLSAFLTPDLEVFFGGTYFPPKDQLNMPGFHRVLTMIRDMWEHERDEIQQNAAVIQSRIVQMDSNRPSGHDLDIRILQNAVETFKHRFDAKYGGFGSAPKFPQPGVLLFLLNYGRAHEHQGASEMALFTLDRVSRSGIHDHLGGGFHRYSVDEGWLVPHFEKMLYDNALLSKAYTLAYAMTENTTYRCSAISAIDHVLDEMTHPEGGFYSARDADSEGVEGKYYVWTQQELEQILDDEELKHWFRTFVNPDGGNWEGKLILVKKDTDFHIVSHGSKDDTREQEIENDRLDEIHKKLLAHREKRISPALDTKILTDWNSLMISSLCSAQRIFSESRYGDAAKRAAQYILNNHSKENQLYHTLRQADVPIPGFLLDYGAFCSALIDLYETSFDETWLEQAKYFHDRAISSFYDWDEGGFYQTDERRSDLPLRRKDPTESVVPSGTALILENELRFTQYGMNSYIGIVEQTLGFHQPVLLQYPGAVPTLLSVLDRFFQSPATIVLACKKEWPSMQKAMKRLNRKSGPYDTVIHSDPDQETSIPLLIGKKAVTDRAVIYFCDRKGCRPPQVLNNPDEVDSLTLPRSARDENAFG